MAHVVAQVQKPTLILAPNKILAAQLYGEMKSFFPEQCRRVLRLVLRLLPARGVRAAHRHLHREDLGDQRADRPHAPFGDPGAARARRRDHRRLGVLHLRHRLARGVRQDGPQPAPRPAGRARAPAARPGRAAVQAQRPRLPPRHLPRARRLDRDLPRPPGGPRLAPVAVRRRDRGDRRVRPADRRAHRHARARQALPEQPLRDPQAHAARGGRPRSRSS